MLHRGQLRRGAVPGQGRPLQRAGAGPQCCDAPARNPRERLLLLHVPDGAGVQHRHHHDPIHRGAVRTCRHFRPLRRARVLHARRHAGRHLDPGRAIHHPDHCVPHTRHWHVAHGEGRQQPLQPHPPARVRRGPAAHRGARAGVRQPGPRGLGGPVRGAEAEPQGLFHAVVLPHGRDGVAAARADALLHDAYCPRGAAERLLESPLHLRPLCHRAGVRCVLEARGVPKRHREAAGRSPRLDIQVRGHRLDEGLQEIGRISRRGSGGLPGRKCIELLPPARGPRFEQGRHCDRHA
mmetsp:Transcript_20630/g.57807  ORF Transcript_20630/g.57807 Transcript_20630/m.57807 type:complete len:294 (+) Transcript_20630:728-1609(+)